MDLKKIAHSVRLSVSRLASQAASLTGGTARKEMSVAVVVQCRLSSTRLPRKALLPLGGSPLVEWTLRAMERVAGAHYLACDTDSADQLAPIAKRRGWKVYSGEKDDVLARFCGVIDTSGADVVVRATADNPFLFFEAAQSLLEEFLEANKEGRVDYMTYTGLPHGSGVEVFLASSLKEAARETQQPYDREHVGPALYAHKDRWQCVFKDAPDAFRSPTLRTTVDTAFDYRRALRIVEAVSSGAAGEPYTAASILGAFTAPAVAHPALLVPCVKKGCGTGHLRRCLALSRTNRWDIYIPRDATLPQVSSLVEEEEAAGLERWQVVDSLEEVSSYDALVADLFVAEGEFARHLAAAAPVIALDEGSKDAHFADYLLDVIPPVDKRRRVNRFAPDLIPLPEHTRLPPTSIVTALVCLGGEDQSVLLQDAVCALLECGIRVTAVSPSEATRQKLLCAPPDESRERLSVVPPVDNLKERLADFDLVVTHYGFTAYEARAAGCAVLLLATTRLHERLASKWGFVCLGQQQITASALGEIIAKPERLVAARAGISAGQGEDLAAVVSRLAAGKRYGCPICGERAGFAGAVVARAEGKTYRRCGTCQMIYLAWSVHTDQPRYDHAYFWEDYRRQYGKSYLEDFDAIKAVCDRRISTIGLLYKIANRNASSAPAVLDVGCAMGPFLQAASDAGWRAFGADISSVAVDYVQNTLGFPALCSAFPDSDFVSQFGVERFDAVTMWYVIEHFKDLDATLKKVAAILKPGGIFAFSTPSAEGVSARFCRQHFFDASPADHYSLWEPSRVKDVISRYGLKVVRVVSTGLHPERIPIVKKVGLAGDGTSMRVVKGLMGRLGLGDTFEVYAKRI